MLRMITYLQLDHYMRAARFVEEHESYFSKEGGQLGDWIDWGACIMFKTEVDATRYRLFSRGIITTEQERIALKICGTIDISLLKQGLHIVINIMISLTIYY